MYLLFAHGILFNTIQRNTNTLFGQLLGLNRIFGSGPV